MGIRAGFMESIDALNVSMEEQNEKVTTGLSGIRTQLDAMRPILVEGCIVSVPN